MNKVVEKMRKQGYPLRIRGNDGYEAYLVGAQPLCGNEYAGIYRYPGGDCVHFLEDIRSTRGFEIIED